MHGSREDFAKLYDDRVRDLQSQLTSERGNNASSSQELKESRSRIEQLISKVSDLEGANLALNQKIADMAQDMEDQKSAHRAQMAAKDDEIKRLLDELANQLNECEEDRLGLGDRSLDNSDASEPHMKTHTERK